MLEERLREAHVEKGDLEKRIKEMEIKQKEQGKALERLANEEEY